MIRRRFATSLADTFINMEFSTGKKLEINPVARSCMKEISKKLSLRYIKKATWVSTTPGGNCDFNTK
jgi:hypothetical protein